MSEKKTGTVKWFDVDKGHGFIIVDGGGEIFVHFNQIRAGRGQRDLYKGQRVNFIETSYGGKLQAGQVEVIDSQE